MSEQKKTVTDFHTEGAIRNAVEAANRGRDILESLQQQNEDLESTEDTLESNEYILQKSIRILRGMTWSGMLYNTFSGEGRTETSAVPTTSQKSSAARPSASSSGTAGAGTRGSNSTTSGGGHITVLDSSLPQTKTDKDLAVISQAVGELHSMSLLIGDSLKMQNEALDRIQAKTEIVHDKTLQVTIKATQLTNHRTAEQFCGQFQFADMFTKSFLAADELDNLFLSTDVDRSTYFNVFARDHNIIGLQNAKTLKFLGVTWTGALRVSGRNFGKYEECHVSLVSGRETGIFCVPVNWGGGGWLKRPYRRSGDLDEKLIITSYTSGVTDKTDIIDFIPLLISPPGASASACAVDDEQSTP